MVSDKTPAGPPPDRLTEAERKRILAWARDYFSAPKVKHYAHPRILKGLWENCRDHYEMTPPRKPIQSWEACFRNWVRKSVEFDLQNNFDRSGLLREYNEMPQERGVRSGQMSLGDAALRVVKGGKE